MKKDVEFTKKNISLSEYLALGNLITLYIVKQRAKRKRITVDAILKRFKVTDSQYSQIAYDFNFTECYRGAGHKVEVTEAAGYLGNTAFQTGHRIS